MKKEFTYLSADGVTSIHAICWIPDGDVKAIIQVSHGMTEYANCYDEYAQAMNKHGYMVVGNDHLGHGLSVRSEEYYGYFDKIQYVMKDMHKLRQIVQKKYPDAPYFLLGFSMGSNFTRQYIQLYGAGLAGTIIMGSCALGNPDQFIGPVVCHLLRVRHGKLHYSKMIDDKGFVSFLDRIENPRTEKDWLCSNEAFIDKYLADELCQKVKLKVVSYREMGLGILHLQKPKNIAKIPKDLPIYLIYGEEDPVGRYGADVLDMETAYKKAGIKNVLLKAYPKCRHHLFFEDCKEQVFTDIVNWIEKRI